jgi:hypothetical protein
MYNALHPLVWLPKRARNLFRLASCTVPGRSVPCGPPKKRRTKATTHKLSGVRLLLCCALLCSALLCCLYELLTLESLTLSFIERLGHFKQLLRLLISSIDSVSDFDGRNQSCWLHPPPLPPPPHLLSSSPLRIGKSGGRKEDDE